MSPYRYIVLGAGRQGTAAAYDLARFGDAAEIVLADARLEVAQRAAARVNRLIGRAVAAPRQADVTNHAALVEVLSRPCSSWRAMKRMARRCGGLGTRRYSRAEGGHPLVEEALAFQVVQRGRLKSVLHVPIDC